MTATAPAQRNPLRNFMPDRRANETFQIDHVWGRATPMEQAETMTVTFARHPDTGRIGEVFVNCDNHLNARAIAMWHDIGVLVSIALQHGATIEELSSAMTRSEVPVMDRMVTVTGSPAGTLLSALAEIEAEAPSA